MKIFLNLPVWGVITANVAFDASYYTLLITMPLFLRDVHKFNVATVRAFERIFRRQKNWVIILIR